MSDQLATGAAHAPEGLAAPEAVSAVDAATSTTATESAEPAAEPLSDEGAPTDSPPVNDQDATQPVKAKPSARDRIAEVIAERNAERERTKAAADAAEFWRKKALGEPEAAPEPPKPPPKLADFEYDTDQWAQAHAKWTEEQIDQRAQAAAQRLLEQRGRSEQQSQVIRAFESRETEFAKAHPDYHAVTGDPRLAEFSTPTIAQVMAASEQGPAIGYHLATHPDELVRISRMNPLQQAQALGRIEATLQKAPTTAVKKTVTTTRAPAPPSPVGGAVPSKHLQDMDIGEYMAARTWGRPQ